jgi:hypothetical protein
MPDIPGAVFVPALTRPVELVLLILAAAVVLPGCGLGYVDIVPEESVSIRIENDAVDPAEVTVSVEWAASSDEGTATKSLLKKGTGKAAKLLSDALIRVTGGNVSSGEVLCGEMITVAAVLGEAAAAQNVSFSGEGTGTAGFDSGSMGTDGERFLLAGDHFECGDMILIRISAAGNGEVFVLPEGTPLPDPIVPPDDTDPTEPTTTDPEEVAFRLENATATTVDITITPEQDTAADEPETAVSIRVAGGQFSAGEIACGQTYAVAAAIGGTDATAVLFSGEGTGTIGFDSSSIGVSGERLLLFGEHYACGNTIVVHVSDDGTGIGLSTSDTPLGELRVYTTGQTVPEPELPDPDNLDEDPLQEEVTLVLVNGVESCIQVHFAAGTGSPASTDGSGVLGDFDVRVPAGLATTGSGICAQEYVISAAHLETLQSTYTQSSGDTFASDGSVNYHAVVLHGDGTGTEGFDSNSVAVVDGRLLQLGTHFNCGDTITVMVTATNNQLQRDANGDAVVDQFGNPTIQYGVGTGSILVSPGS